MTLMTRHMPGSIQTRQTIRSLPILMTIVAAEKGFVRLVFQNSKLESQDVSHLTRQESSLSGAVLSR